MSWRRNESASPLERTIAAFCYPTGGILGIIYIIISRNSSQSDFFRFHFLQAIVLSIMSFLLGWACQIFGQMFAPALPAIVDFLSKLIPAALLSGLITGTLLMFDAVSKAFLLLIVYGFIWAALGKIAEIPFISNIVRQQMR